MDEKGHGLPNHLLHHLDFYNTARRSILRPEFMEIMFATGSELQEWLCPTGTGYHMNGAEEIVMEAMVANETGVSYRNVYLEVRMNYTPYSEQASMKSIFPLVFIIHRNKEGKATFDLRPGLNLVSNEAVIPQSGRLLMVGGHLHDYGREIKLENATRGEPIVVLEPKLDDQGKFLSLPVVSLEGGGGYAVKRGETLKLTAIYENPTSFDIGDAAMGWIVGAFLPDHKGGLD